MHNAIEKDVADRSYERAGKRASPRHSQGGSEYCRQSEQSHTDQTRRQSGDGRSQESMKKSMNRVFVAEQIITGLQVHKYLSRTKYEEAETFRNCSLYSRGRAEVKRRERHTSLVRPVRVLAQIVAALANKSNSGFSARQCWGGRVVGTRGAGIDLRFLPRKTRRFPSSRDITRLTALFRACAPGVSQMLQISLQTHA